MVSTFAQQTFILPKAVCVLVRLIEQLVQSVWRLILYVGHYHISLVLWFLEAVFFQWLRGKFTYRNEVLRAVRSDPYDKLQCCVKACRCFSENFPKAALKAIILCLYKWKSH